MKESLSIKLFRTLQKGKEQLSKEALDRIIGFIESQRTEEESFINKSGKADLYYTLFGWMLSYILGIRLNAEKAGLYLNKQKIESLDLIHYAAYMRCRMILRLQERGKVKFALTSLLPTKIKNLQEFNGLPHNDPKSPYTQFIRLSLQEDIRHRVSDKKNIIDSLATYHVSGGGFMNTTDGLTATTNATVAALAVTGQLVGYKENADVHYLRDLQESSGGFGAAEASPIPDLLSTATSLFMLSCYKIQPKYSARDFIEGHWLESGGFSATLLEDKSDVEYTFYGLLALGASPSLRGTKQSSPKYI